MIYEGRKHTGEFLIIGVNTFKDPNTEETSMSLELELARATESEKKSHLVRLVAFKEKTKQSLELL
jgi:methylmalonyl-CoA mutase